MLDLFNRRLWGAAAISLLIGSPAMAATFNPTTAAEFQADLDSAEANGEDDTITLPAGTFSTEDNSGNSFDFSSSEANSLAIQGAGGGSTFLVTDPDSPNTLMNITNSGSGADVSLMGITFEGGNSYGAFVLTGDGALAAQDLEFIGNYYGIYFSSSSGSISVGNSLFQGNQYGLNLSVNTGTGTVTDCIFEDQNGSGAGIYAFGGDFALDIQQSTFKDNASNSSASGVYLGFAGEIRLIRNWFEDNQASGSAGAAYITNAGNFVAIDNVFTENSSSAGTGGLYVSSSDDSVLLVNNTFTGNSSSSYAGALVVFPDSVSAETLLYNNIFYGNSTGVSGGQADDIAIFDDFSGTGSPVTLANNVIGEAYLDCRDDGSCTPDLVETGTLSEDPLFLDAEAGNFNLAAGSPAIGAGDPAAPQLPSVDFTGRNLNNPPDIGAFAAISGLVVNPLGINFGNTEITIPDTQTVSLTNNGAIPVAVSALTLSDEENFSLDASDCGGSTPTLAPGDSCDLLVSFDPVAAGSVNGTLTVDSNDSAQPSVAVQLSGVGIDGDLDGGGCSLGGVTPASAYLGWALVPLLWAFRRSRR